jgi:exopolysaccharide production protein ExoZ
MVLETRTEAGVVSDGKLEGLQVARALAALSVAYFHSHTIFTSWHQATLFPIPGVKEHGYLGVNFFFAISGYVICTVCDRPNFSVRAFAIKRIFRLYPVYWAIVLAAILLKFCGVIIPTSYKLLNILYSMTLLPQAETAQPFLAVTWSLEFEIVFYILAALIIPVFGVWGLAAVLFGLVYWTFHHTEPAFSFHLLRTLNSDFLAGVLAYLLRKPLSSVPVWLLIPCGLFSYYNVVSGWLISFSGSFGGFLLVSAFANAKWRWRLPPLRWLTTVGDASYSLYLLHYVVIWIFVKLAERLGSPPAWTAEPMRFIYLGICVWLSIQAYRFIERPMIELGNRLAARRQSGHVEGTAGIRPYQHEDITRDSTRA